MAEKEVIITFDTLYDLARREKYRAEIQKVDAKFFDDVVKYFSEKQAIIESQEQKKSVFAAAELDKTRAQLREAKKLLADIYKWREDKIVQAAVFQSRCSGKAFDFSALLPEEIELFNLVQGTLTGHREKVLHALLSHELPKICCNKAPAPESADEPSDALKASAAGAPDLSLPKGLKTNTDKSDGSCCITIKCQLPEFMGPDMNKYGPFNPDDQIEMPGMVAEMLVKSGNAEIK
ncbi:MAG TPA: hypothetical protein HA362_04405 [Nanoarchaeota archaeon]|nr:hypothetical protein [Nanoarchaeota archaeon]